MDAIARVYYRTLGQPPQASGMADRRPRQGRGAPSQERDVPAVAHRSPAFPRRSTIVLLVEGEFAPTSFFVVLWAVSPLLMHWLRQPGPVAAPGKSSAREETHFLRGVARETWRFFDDLVGPESNWLPPDNYQLALRVEVAQRTSPTNIGLWLTSALAARDFGYLTADEFCLRCSHTMETLGAPGALRGAPAQLVRHAARWSR